MLSADLQWRSQNEAENAMALHETNLLRFLLVFFYQFSTVRQTSVTDDIIDWPLPKKKFLTALLLI